MSGTSGVPFRMLFRRRFMSPFELVVASRPSPVLREPVGPSRPTVEVGGAKYELHEDPRVRAPEITVEERLQHDYFTWARVVPPLRKTPDSPEVVLRKAVRLCLENRVPTDQMSEIVKTELVDFVMES